MSALDNMNETAFEDDTTKLNRGWGQQLAMRHDNQGAAGATDGTTGRTGAEMANGDAPLDQEATDDAGDHETGAHNGADPETAEAATAQTATAQTDAAQTGAGQTPQHAGSDAPTAAQVLAYANAMATEHAVKAAATGSAPVTFSAWAVKVVLSDAPMTYTPAADQDCGCPLCAAQPHVSDLDPDREDGSTWDANASDNNGFLEEPQFNGSGAATVSVSASGDQSIDGLLSGVRWSGSITYSDPDTDFDYPFTHSENFTNFSQMTAQQMVAVHFGLNATLYTQPAGAVGFSVQGFTGLGVSYAGSGSGSGTIRLANTDDPVTAYAYGPSGAVEGGDVFFGGSGSAPDTGDYDWHTVLHEIGHALGLSHGHTGGAYGALASNEDSLEFSIMTYRSYIGAPDNGHTYESWGAPQTFMMLDIAALQYMYGANFSINNTDTVYKWNPGSGDTLVNGTVGIDAGGNVIFNTVWDGGGVDTYDLSSYSSSLEIDLRPGEGSTFDATQLADLNIVNPGTQIASHSVYNALQYQGNTGSLIERAIGGSGGDTITGNSAGNYLTGNDGDDVLYGGTGNDTIAGGNDDDVLDGGMGADFLYGGTGHDSLYGATEADYISAGGNRDYASGGSGDDSIYGEDGQDSLYGDDDNDYLSGGDGSDFLSGGTGTDTLLGGNNADTLRGGDGNDDLYGHSAADKLRGEAGDDTLSGGGDADVLKGGSGSDFLSGGSGKDTLVGGSDDDTLKGGSGADKLSGGSGADLLNASLGNDTLKGENGNDTLDAGSGDDVLAGGNGMDAIEGGSGNDTMSGGQDADTFIFTSGFGHDVISDFDAADAEKIDFSGLGAIVDFDDLVNNHLSNSGGFALIDVSAKNAILLDGVAFADVGMGELYSASDFVF